MESFASIQNRAAGRKGGQKALDALMPEVKSPAQLKKIPDDRWLSEMTKCVFRAGFNWKVIENKWPGFEEAFDGFDPAALALLSDDAIDALIKDTRIVRNAQKIITVPANAALLVDLAREHGSAAAFFADWPNEDFVGLLDFLKKRGSRLGGATAQIFLRFMGRDSFMMRSDVATALVGAGVVDKPPTSKRDIAAVQAAFNDWAKESGLPFSHISRTLACSVGGNSTP